MTAAGPCQDTNHSDERTALLSTVVAVTSASIAATSDSTVMDRSTEDGNNTSSYGATTRNSTSFNSQDPSTGVETVPSSETDEDDSNTAVGETDTSNPDGETPANALTADDTTPAAAAVGDDDSTDGDADEENRDGAIGTLTRRLRCLFSTITWPIVPLGTIVALALLWVLYAASSLDLRKSCSHPLHWYALASLVLMAYIPHHAQVRSHLFHYSRERDGPIRPARVRMYDQFFHTVCLLYVYTGVTLIQTCREDLVNGEEALQLAQSNDVTMAGDGPLNSCEATCPNLYQALSVYVATLEMFTFALILPLLFLPCIYLWFLRRATAEAEAFAQLQDRLQEEEALLSNGGVTAAEILDSLENVKLVSRTETSNSVSGESEQEIWLLPYSATDASIGMKSDVKECCICMSDFPIQNEADLEDGLFEDKTTTSNANAQDNNFNNGSGTGNEEIDPSNDRPKHADNEDSSMDLKDSGIVRTRCGHVFHKECLAGWVGGRWQLNPNATSSSNEDIIQDRRRRRARQTCCPLCREDLRPVTN
jgi:hypothetical protein